MVSGEDLQWGEGLQWFFSTIVYLPGGRSAMGDGLQLGKVCNGFSVPLYIFRGKVCNGGKVCNITPA